MNAIEERKYTDEQGYDHLLLSGPQGGVSALIMPTGVEGINPVGVLTIHYRPDYSYLNPAQTEPQSCPDFGGTCCPENAFRAGQEVADWMTSGAEVHAWGVMRDWYESRLGSGRPSLWSA